MDRFTPWSEITAAIAAVRPSFVQDVKGASGAEIARLESVMPAPLPEEYAGFLALMGHGMGGITILSSDFDLDTIYEAYSSSPWTPPTDLVLIAEQQDDEAAHDLCISREPDRFGAVVRAVLGAEFSNDANPSSYAHEVFPEALSLQSLIFRYAFYQFYLVQAPCREMIVGDRTTAFDDLEPILGRVGFTKHQLSDAWSEYYVGMDGGVAYLRPSGAGNQLLVGTKAPSKLSKVCDLLQQAVGARKTGPF